MLRLQEHGGAVDFLTSDHHFGHKRISAFAGRGYDDRLDKMHEMMIQRWNEVVSPSDTVLHLGDFAFGPRSKTLRAAQRLNGTILFIPGNHDAVSRLCGGRRRKLYEKHFAEVLPETCDRLLTAAGNVALVSHYPFDDPHASAAMRELMPPDDGQSLLVHGHTHQRDTVRDRQFHVGVDSHDYRPVPAARIAEWIDANS